MPLTPPAGEPRPETELEPNEIRPPSHWSKDQRPAQPNLELNDDELRQCRAFGSFVLWMALVTAMVWIIWLALHGLQATLFSSCGG